jgi:hypothetical protein
MSMDDIPPAITECDIHAHVSRELEGLDFQDREFAVLAKTADGLFEWAHLTCSVISQILDLSYSRIYGLILRLGS